MTVDNEAKLIAQQNRGAVADAELKVTGDSFKALRAEYGKAWENSDPRDTAGREKLWLATTILTKVEEALRAHVSTGKIAQQQLDALRSAGEPKSEKPVALRLFRRP
jgi:hypothetical protein